MMPQMHLHVLASGSKGNASVVEGPTGSVLIDDGLSRRELLRRADELSVDMDRICCVVVTHEHADHVSGLTVFCNKYEGRLVATAGTAGGRKYLAQLPFELVGDADEFEAGGMRVRTFPTSHDVADPLGLRFDCGAGDEADSLGFCTDTGMLGDRALELLSGVRVLALESNHDARMLATGPYPGFLKQRVAGDHGHLSNDQAADALRELNPQNLRTLLLAHLSSQCNADYLAVEAMARALRDLHRADITLAALAQDEPSALYEF